MTVVLDAQAAAALASPGEDSHGVVRAAIAHEVCYIASVAAVVMYGTIHDRISKDAADYWLRFVTSGHDVRVDSSADPEFLELAGEATLKVRRLLSTGFSAALAHRLGVPLITNVEEADLLERDGFCQVRKF